MRVLGVTNSDLLREMDSLVALMEGIVKRPNTPTSENNKVVVEIMDLVEDDGVVVLSEILVRVNEFGERERLGCLGFGEIVELVCVLKRLEMCRERMMVVEEKGFWDSVKELKEKVGRMKVYTEERKVYGKTTKDRRTESDRFDDRVLNSVGSIMFPSSRFF